MFPSAQKLALLFAFVTGLFFVTLSPVHAITIPYSDSDAYLSGSSPQNNFVGDISGDGKDDLLILTSNTNTTLYVYLNGNIPSGTTDLTSATNFNVKYTNIGASTYGYPYSVLIQDVNGDGKNDIAVGDNNNVYIIPSTSVDDYQGQTNQVINISSTSSAYWIKLMKSTGFNIRNDINYTFWVSDVDGDSNKDIVLSTESRTIYYINNSIFSGLPMGSSLDLATATNYTALMTTANKLCLQGLGLNVGDVTADGKADLVMSSCSGNGSLDFLFGSQLSTLIGTGNTIDLSNDANLNMRLTGTASIQFWGFAYQSVKLGDVTNDGKTDVLLVVNSTGTTIENGIMVFSSTLIDNWEGALGATASLATNTSYSYYLTGVKSSENYELGAKNGMYIGDINENGVNDLVIRDKYYSVGCTKCGAAYVFLDSLLATFVGSSAPNNTFDLGTATNYSVIIKGSTSWENTGIAGTLIGDMSNDTKNDLVLPSGDHMYLYLSSKFAALGTSTGTTWPTSDAGTYNRIYEYVLCGSMSCLQYAKDINGDNLNDLILGQDDSWIFFGGIKISNLDASLAVEMDTDGTIDPEVTGQGGTKNVVITKSGIPFALVATTFSNIDGQDWTSVAGDTNDTTGKSVVTGLDSAAGAAATHSVLVKKLTGSIGVYVCPSATALVDVTEVCASGYQVLNGDSDLSIVSKESIDYWKLSGLTSTGVMNVVDEDAPTGSISINAGDSITNNPNTTISLSASDAGSGVGQMMLSENADFSGASYEAYATSKAFALTAVDGTKTVYVKFKDGAGNVSTTYSDTIDLDTAKPPVNITNIGLINNVPDKSPLFYYFTSQTPHIKGKTQAGSIVHYTYDGEDYTTTANGAGDYEIDIDNPALPRQYVELEYYAVDPAGNQSSKRLLRMIIGVENFPITVTETDSNTSATLTPTPSVTLPPNIEPTEPAAVFLVKLTDSKGNTLANTPVFINGQRYMSDANGNVVTEKAVDASMAIEVEFDGKRVKASVLGEKIVVTLPTSKKPSIKSGTWIVIALLLAGIVGGGFLILPRKK